MVKGYITLQILTGMSINDQVSKNIKPLVIKIEPKDHYIKLQQIEEIHRLEVCYGTKN